LFQLFEDQPLFWSAWDIDPYALETGRDLVRSESFEIVERGPVRVAAEVVKKFGASHIRQRISLGPTPGIRFDTEIEWHEENQLLKVAFPVNVHSSRATFDIQFGNVERPTHQNTSWDLARFEVCAHKWVDLSEGDQGVALINDCKYGHDVVGNVMRLTLLRAPKAPDPICDMGRHRFTYVLLPHFGGVAYGGVVAAGYAVNTPLRHASLAPHRGVDGALPMLAACDDRNVVVETVKRSEDGRAIIVRLYECHNSRGRAELSCARPIRRAALCDLEENELAELEIVEGGVRFAYKPFEILTILLDI
ncbi:MAG: alpha-mannosidase, partial [Fimbriimonas ginsengisoli]|nr:alpha-mannosidase [Fimbriimonas ginsengisoli]